MDNAIVTAELTKLFQVNNEKIHAVDNLSFEIERGQIIGLLGPNGAGKTTTVRLIASLFEPSSGKSFVNGFDSQTESLTVRKMIGLSHERPSFYSKLSGRRNLEFYAELYDVPSTEIAKRINFLATDFDLIDAIDQPVGSYSKGMTQKLSVCKALIHDADIIIFDEPWSGLSPGATRDLRNKIKQLGSEEGKTILITTHNLAQAEQVVDSLIIIAKGSIIAQGSPAKLREEYHLIPQLIISFIGEFASKIDIINNLDYIQNYTVKDNHIIISIESFSFTPKLIKFLVSNQLQIKEVKERIPSLEEIYLSLVEVDE